MKYLLIILLAFVSFRYSAAQSCSVEVEATADPVLLCPPGGLVQLSGSVVNGTALNVYWTPAAGMSNPNGYNTSVNVTTTTTFTFHATAFDENNLIFNGDFDFGNIGFTSDYIYSATNLVPEGVYTVNINPNAVHAGFAPCPDHTSGSGQMMVVNGSGVPNQEVWCQDVSVDPNTMYSFSAWVTSVVAASPARLQFSINGQLIGPVFIAPSTVCNWVPFNATWNSGGATTATICIVNQNTVLGGNDFALDDLVFQGTCIDSASVTVEVIDLTAAILPPDVLNCYHREIQLDGSPSSSGPDVTYLWTTLDGNIVGGETTLNPTVDEEGTYTLRVIYDDADGNHCEKTAQIQVFGDFAPPTVRARADSVINCRNEMVLLNGTGSSTGPNFDYLWTSLDGNIVDGQGTLFPLVDAPGWYTLSVLNLTNGCEESVDVLVREDIVYPRAVANSRDTINCLRKSVQINGAGSSTGSIYSYYWYTGDGNIINGYNTLQPTVNAGGTYSIVVTNGRNGCQTEASVEVIGDNESPEIYLQQPAELSCLYSEVDLYADVDVDGPFVVEWTTFTGNIIEENGQEARVDAAGIYFVTVRNLRNHCESTDEIEVFENRQLPTAEAGALRQISCNSDRVRLDGSASSRGRQYSYRWTTANGNILSGRDSLNPMVNQPGLYRLEVYDEDNGCLSWDTVRVLKDATIPVVSIRPPDTLDCRVLTTQLDARNSSNGANFDLRWTTVGGQFLDSNLLTRTVNRAGIYSLQIVNRNNGCKDSVRVQVVANQQVPSAFVPQPPVLNCLQREVELTLQSADSLQNFQINWLSPNGHFTAIDSAKAVVDQPGMYIFHIQNPDNFCQFTDTVEVIQNVVFPFAEAGTAQELSCNADSLTLDGAGSSTGQQFRYEWRGGRITSPTNILQPTVSAAGWYFLQVTDLTNGCAATDSVLVTRSADYPALSIALPDTLNCVTQTVDLNARNSARGSNFDIVWQTRGGNFLPSADPLFGTTDAPGIYILSIFDRSNGCLSVDSVEVAQDVWHPIIDVEPFAELNCGNRSLELVADIISPRQNADLQWLAPNGDPIPGANQTTLTVSEGGIYTMRVINRGNGCESVTGITVTEDFAIPTVLLAEPDTLNCRDRSVPLNATGSSYGADFQYVWRKPDGSTVGSATLDATEAGVYQLAIFNQKNQCADSVAVIVVQDRAMPVAEAGSSVRLTCRDTVLQLDGLTSSQGAEFAYFWDTSDGKIESGDQTLTPTISRQGTYLLKVFNLRNYCEAGDFVVVTEDKAPPTIAILPPEILTCEEPQIILDATTSSSGANFEYLWTNTTNGIVSGATTLMPEISQPGVYTLIINNLDNGCAASAEVTVQQDARFPTLRIAPPLVLNCQRRQVQLDASASSGGVQFQYRWSTADGNILSSSNVPLISVNAPGAYSLQITDSTNNCATTGSILVEQDTLAPDVAAVADDTLTCAVRTVSLTANATGSGSNFDYLWTTTNGQILGDPHTPIPAVAAAGDYFLEVTDLLNHCKSTISIPVFEDVQKPVITTILPDTLTCSQTEVTLSANATGSGQAFSYNWTTQTGQPISTQSFAKTTQPGAFSVEVTDTKNGCKNIAQVAVAQDIQKPTAAAFSPEIYTCKRRSFALSGAGSSTGSEFEYRWLSPNGRILSGGNTLNPTVGAPGIYELKILNRHNGCENTASVAVAADTILPTILIANPAELTCLIKEIQLDATGSSAAAPLTFQWTTANGNILFGNATATPMVNARGDYFLNLTNDQNGCQSAAQVRVNQDIRLPAADAGEQKELNCTDTLVVLIGTASAANGQYAIEWTTVGGQLVSNLSSLTPTANRPGIYTLQITDLKNGCTASDFTEVVRDENILAAISTRSDLPKCFGETGAIFIETTIGGTPPFEYSINGGEDFFLNPDFENLPSGTYRLLVRDAKGCEVSEVLKIPFVPENYVETTPEIHLVLGESQRISLQTNLTANRIASVTWTPAEGLSCSDCLNPMVTGLTPNVYTVTIEDVNGCVVSARTTLTVEKEYNVYIPNAFSPNLRDNINDVFHIYARDGQVARVHNFLIFNRWGELVFEDYDFLPNDPAHGWDGTHRGEVLDPAVFVYYAEVEFIDGTTQLFKGDVTLVK